MTSYSARDLEVVDAGARLIIVQRVQFRKAIEEKAWMVYCSDYCITG